jgi:hypothetical protein
MRNAVQKLLYAIAVLLTILMVWSGLVLWKPVQFEEIGVPLGNYEGARYVHFFGMTGLVLFIIVHLALTILVPKVLPPMITGRAARSAVAIPGSADKSGSGSTRVSAAAGMLASRTHARVNRTIKQAAPRCASCCCGPP